MSIRKKHLLILSFILVFTTLFSYCYSCENCLTVREYSINSERIENPIKILFISDLHSKEFGKNNTNLLTAIESQKPDIISIGGDMINMTDKSHNKFISLLRQLTNIAPTYYVLGNHELAYNNLKVLIEDIQSTNAVFLDNSMEQIVINNETVTIGGLTSFPYFEKYYPDFETEERYFMDSFIEQQEENFSVLLTHQPEFYFWNWGLKEKNIDLMLCGHTHGGVVQLPFVGGVYAPNQGFFPEYDKGYFSSGSANMIITSGLGNTSSVPRINNEPEICIININ